MKLIMAVCLVCAFTPMTSYAQSNDTCVGPVSYCTIFFGS